MRERSPAGFRSQEISKIFRSFERSFEPLAGTARKRVLHLARETNRNESKRRSPKTNPDSRRREPDCRRSGAADRPAGLSASGDRALRRRGPGACAGNPLRPGADGRPAEGRNGRCSRGCGAAIGDAHSRGIRDGPRRRGDDRARQIHRTARLPVETGLRRRPAHRHPERDPQGHHGAAVAHRRGVAGHHIAECGGWHRSHRFRRPGGIPESGCGTAHRMAGWRGAGARPDGRAAALRRSHRSAGQQSRLRAGGTGDANLYIGFAGRRAHSGGSGVLRESRGRRGAGIGPHGAGYRTAPGNRGAVAAVAAHGRHCQYGGRVGARFQ